MSDVIHAGPSISDVEQAMFANALRVGDWVKINNGTRLSTIWEINSPAIIKLLRETNIWVIEEIRREQI